MDDLSGANIQNDFFNQARKEKTRVAVFLNSGKRLGGRIKSFDKYTLLLDTPFGDQIVFKHAIATVGPDSAPRESRGGFSNRMELAGPRPVQGRGGEEPPASE